MNRISGYLTTLLILLPLFFNNLIWASSDTPYFNFKFIQNTHFPLDYIKIHDKKLTSSTFGTLWPATFSSKQTHKKTRGLLKIFMSGEIQPEVYQEVKILNYLNQNHYMQMPKYYGLIEIKSPSRFEDHMALALQRRGNNLSESIDEYKKHFIEYSIQLVMAVMDLHRLGVIHRDLKAENVLLYKGKIYLIDFGSAYLESQAEDPIGSGTLGYVGDIVAYTKGDKREDFFALASILWLMRYKSLPLYSVHSDSFEGHYSYWTYLIQKGYSKDYQQNKHRLKCHDHLDEILVEMLSPNPEDRPQLDTLLKALQQLVP